VSSKALKENLKKAVATGDTPLDFLLRVMGGKEVFEEELWVKGKKHILKRKPMFSERFDAAKSAAPFMHPKLVAQANLGLDPDENDTSEQEVAKEKLRAKLLR